MLHSGQEIFSTQHKQKNFESLFHTNKELQTTPTHAINIVLEIVDHCVFQLHDYATLTVTQGHAIKCK